MDAPNLREAELRKLGRTASEVGQAPQAPLLQRSRECNVEPGIWQLSSGNEIHTDIWSANVVLCDRVDFVHPQRGNNRLRGDETHCGNPGLYGLLGHLGQPTLSPIRTQELGQRA